MSMATGMVDERSCNLQCTVSYTVNEDAQVPQVMMIIEQSSINLWGIYCRPMIYGRIIQVELLITDHIRTITRDPL